jgi:hypothetical protein
MEFAPYVSQEVEEQITAHPAWEEYWNAVDASLRLDYQVHLARHYGKELPPVLEKQYHDSLDKVGDSLSAIVDDIGCDMLEVVRVFVSN